MASKRKMRDRVIVTSYWRPEFLYLCLEGVYAAEGSHDKEICVYEDQRPNDAERFEQDMLEVQEVLAYWKRGFGDRLRTILRNPHTSYGNSFNVLSAYHSAFEDKELRYIHLIEDDVLISTDYFQWQEQMQAGEYLATIAGETSRCPRPETNFNGLFESEVYASLGVCWKRENLSWVTEHAVPSYYNNSTLHLLKHFKGSKYGLTMQEQDGLIQRIAEQQFQKFAWSVPTRAFHVGIYGYHRGIAAEYMPTGSLAERIETLRKNISDPEWFKKVADFQTDLQVVPTLQQ